jgi:hypothetical protein
MNSTIPHHLLGLLLVSALAACSGKKDVPPPAPAAAPSTESTATAAPTPPQAPAAPAAAEAAKISMKKATLDCEDRTVVLEATCTDLYGPRMLACTKQSLAVTDRASGAVKSLRRFEAQPGSDGDPPTVEEKIGALSCIRSSTNERYIVADMYNGGNCEQCEWHELYDWDGKLVASDRDRSKRNLVLNELGADLQHKSDRLIGQTELENFYSDTPQR